MITPDELRLTRHHLEAAEASLRLATHCAEADATLHHRINMLAHLTHERRLYVDQMRSAMSAKAAAP